MRRRASLTTLLLILVLLAVHPAQSADPFDAVRQRIRKAVDDGRAPSIAAAVSRGSEIVWEEAFGWANREKNIAATPGTPYSLASISKPITATGLMILAERGKIRLDRPVNEYLGAAKLRAGIGSPAKATIRRVASHTAGLPLHYHFFPVDEAFRRPSMEETISRYGVLVTKPGERYQYSNLGYGILDYVIERASGKTYPEFMREEVFEPLGLSDTFIPTEPEEAARGAVRYHDGEPLPFYDFDHRGGSAVFSSANDLVRFGMFHLGVGPEGVGSVISRRSINHMQKAVTKRSSGGSYGIGWGISSHRGVPTVSHTGSMGGVTTSLLLIPSIKAAVVVLSNTRTALVASFSREIVDILLGKRADPEPDGRTAENTSEANSASRPSLPSKVRGFWEDRIETYQRSVPFRLWVSSSGEAETQVGDQPRAEVLVAAFEDGYLKARVKGGVGTPDAERRRYVLSLDLKLRGETLSGSATALSIPGQKLPNALSYWAELKRTKR